MNSMVLALCYQMSKNNGMSGRVPHWREERERERERERGGGGGGRGKGGRVCSEEWILVLQSLQSRGQNLVAVRVGVSSTKS